MIVSLIIPSYKRAHLLDLGLWSISQHNYRYYLEIIVLNDGLPDNTEYICNKYRNKLNIKYFFTGQRNLKGKEIFRTPSFPLNIGIKKSQGEIIILSSPEIFHLNNAINLLTYPFSECKKILATPKFLYIDNTGVVKKYLSKYLTLKFPTAIKGSLESNTPRCQYASKLPFCMGIMKKELIEIGGYDEDFTGWACDDDDLVQRLILNGLSYHYCNAKVIHLYHPKPYNKETKLNNKDYLHNLKLFKERKNIIKRNVGKDWGVLNES